MLLYSIDLSPSLLAHNARKPLLSLQFCVCHHTWSHGQSSLLPRRSEQLLSRQSLGVHFQSLKSPITLCKCCDAFLEYVCREKCSSGRLKCEIFLPTLSTADDDRVPTEHYCVSWLL